MIYGIIKRIAEKYIQKNLLEERSVKAVNLRKAKSIGILFKASERIYYQELKKLISDIEGHNKATQIQALGWYKGNKVPEFVKQSNQIKLFNKKDYNLFYKPKKTAKNTNAFIESEFDILIDLTQNDAYAIRKVMALCTKAHFKVGPYTLDNEEYYDFLLKYKNPKDYTNQLINYLSILNKNA